MIIHGPMWQPECDLCHDMLDAYDNEEDARDAANSHDCVETLVRVAGYRSGWTTFVERPDDSTIIATYRKGDTPLVKESKT